MSTETRGGSALVQAELWSAGARDWADVMEGWNGWGIPVYQRVMERVPLGAGDRLLDVGCGAGRFCRMAADRGAAVCGLDATEAFVEIARDRVPNGDFRIGEMEDLPWENDSFDLVTGFNSFFIAADMVGALREAGRVARSGAAIATSVFGRPERCDSTRIFAAVGALMSSPQEERTDEDAGEPAPALHEEGVLEDRATQAGLTVRESDYLAFEESYPNLDTVLRGLLAAPPFRRAASMVGMEEVRVTVTEAIRPFETSTEGYRFQEEVRYLVATA